MSFQIHTECEVSGLLSFILWLSRLAGAAPLAFERESKGWRVRVSRKCDIYGKILAVLAVGLCSIALMTDELGDDVFLKNPKNRILWTADVVSAYILSLTVAYTAFNRMRCLIHCVAQLKQINQNLRDGPQVHSNGKKNVIICVLLLILLWVVFFTDYGALVYDVIINNGELLSSFYAVFIVSYVGIVTYVLQFYLIVLSVLSTLRTLNNKLRSLLQPMNDSTLDYLSTSPNQTSKLFKKEIHINVRNLNYDKYDGHLEAAIINSEEKATAVTIRQLGLLYCSLCEIISMLIESNGLTLVTFYASLTQHLTMSSYYVIDGFLHAAEYRNFEITIRQLLWVIAHCAQIFVVTEPCHQTHKEMTLTKDLLNLLKQSTPAQNLATVKEVKVFYRLVILNQITYSPLDLFLINRSLLMAILSNILTYLVIVVAL